MSKENGGPAFPTNANIDVNGDKYLVDEGMSLRDHFAGLAMQSYIASWTGDTEHLPTIAKMSYKASDAMLKERAK